MPLQFRDQSETNRGTQSVEGCAYTNGASAIDNTQNEGKGFTLTRSGIGTANLKITVPAARILYIDVQLSKSAILNRAVHILGKTKGADGLWTVAIALSDLNNAGVVAAEWPAANAAAFVTFQAILQLGAP